MEKTSVQSEEVAAPVADPVTMPIPPVVEASAQAEAPAEPESAPAVETAPDVVQPQAPTEAVEPAETIAVEPATVEPEEEEAAPVAPAEAVVLRQAPASAEATAGRQDDNATNDLAVEKGAPTAEPTIKEVVRETEKPLTDADKDKIFKDKLNANLVRARGEKHAQFEAHLQEIVDFIHKKGTLVTNQDIEDGLRINDTTVTNRLNELIHRGLVMRVGVKRHAKYRLTAAV